MGNEVFSWGSGGVGGEESLLFTSPASRLVKNKTQQENEDHEVKETMSGEE